MSVSSLISLPELVSTDRLEDLPELVSGDRMEDLPVLVSGERMEDLPELVFGERMEDLPELVSSITFDNVAATSLCAPSPPLFTALLAELTKGVRTTSRKLATVNTIVPEGIHPTSASYQQCQ